MTTHPWAPVYDCDSKILILGTMPSPKSREHGFYYGHPQNCFWTTLAFVLGQPAPARNMRSQREFLLRNKIALWDVLYSCEISGAADGSIAKPTANSFTRLMAEAPISKIFTTGKAATDLFSKLCSVETGFTAEYLPSTSPANRAAQKKPDFIEQWRRVAVALAER